MEIDKRSNLEHHVKEAATLAMITVRCNLTMHCSVTPLIIRQPIWRPRLLERVYKPIRT